MKYKLLRIMRHNSLLIMATLLLMRQMTAAQNTSKPLPELKTANGFSVTASDSSFSLSIRLRVQNRIGLTFTENESGTWELIQSEFRVRRARLRFDGFVFNPKWTYAVQLSFSRADQDWDNSGVPNVLRDAMIFYRPNAHWTFGLGQGKLPGNRQRVVS
jgi:hypothetical protein